MMVLQIIMTFLVPLIVPLVCGECSRQRQQYYVTDSSLLNQRPRNALWSSNASRPACCYTCFNHPYCSAVFFNSESGNCLGFVTSTPEADVMEPAPGYVLVRQENICPIAQGYIFSFTLRLCLKHHSTYVTWNDAKSACEAHGDQLAVLRTLEENMFIRAYMESTGKGVASHIGAENVTQTLKWLDGTPVKQTFYAPGEYSTVLYQHLFIMITGWGTGYEATPRHFICQRVIPAP